MLLYTIKSSKPLYNAPLRLAKHKSYGLYGGSFNPVHHGHKAVADYALQSLRLHKIIWLVTPHNPFKDKSIYLPFDKRFAQVKQQVTNNHCIISDIEQIIETQNTYQTLLYLTKRYPNIHFTLIMGSDSVSHLHRWHFFKKFSQWIKFAIIVRPTHRFCIKNFPAIRYFRQHHIHYDLLLKPFQFISSTALRKTIEIQ